MHRLGTGVCKAIQCNSWSIPMGSASVLAPGHAATATWCSMGSSCLVTAFGVWHHLWVESCFGENLGQVRFHLLYLGLAAASAQCVLICVLPHLTLGLWYKINLQQHNEAVT